jgi:hypothetical protein
MGREFRGFLLFIVNFLFIKEVMDCAEIERRKKTVYTV